MIIFVFELNTHSFILYQDKRLCDSDCVFSPGSKGCPSPAPFICFSYFLY